MSGPEVPKQLLQDPRVDVTVAFRQFLQQIASDSGGGSGTVTDVTASDDGKVLLIVTNPTTTPNIAGALADTAVTPGSYTNTNLTVDQQGRITAASNGSAGTTSPLTTKGDVWGYSTTNARIPVGSNGQVLTADSSQTLGLKWAPVTATGSYYFARRFG